MTLGSISMLGWAFILFVTLVVPWEVIRSRENVVAMASVPMSVRFHAMLLPQVVLGVLALVTSLVEGIELFPMRGPSPLAWLAAGAFLGVAVVVVRPQWRRSIKEDKPTWRLFAPTNRRESRMWIVLSLSAGLGEEMVWRGVLPVLIAQLTGSQAIGIALSVGSFAVAHAIQGARSVFAIAAIASAFHALVFLSDSLYPAMLVHFAYDVIAGFTYARFARELGILEPRIE